MLRIHCIAAAGLLSIMSLGHTSSVALAEAHRSDTEGWISFRPEDSMTVDPAYSDEAQDAFRKHRSKAVDSIWRYYRTIFGVGDHFKIWNTWDGGYDLNGDGDFEVLYQVRYNLEMGFPCRPLCNTPVLVIEVVWGENGPDPDPEDYQLVYRGTVFSVGTPAVRDSPTDMVLFAEPNPHSEWKSLTTGPRQVHPTETHLGRSAAFGGDRYCWTDRPQAIDLSRFNWRMSQEHIRFGFDYEEGQEGYFLRIPYDQECPE